MIQTKISILIFLSSNISVQCFVCNLEMVLKFCTQLSSSCDVCAVERLMSHHQGVTVVSKVQQNQSLFFPEVAKVCGASHKACPS